MLECVSPLVDFERSDKADTRDTWREKREQICKVEKMFITLHLTFINQQQSSKMANKYPYIGHSIDQTTMYNSNNQLVTPPVEI